MKLSHTPLKGLLVLTPDIKRDSRGYFFEAYHEQGFQALTGITVSFVQDNQAFSHQHVVRGLHYQEHPKAQAKLVSVVQGVIWDVAVDIRPESPTYLQWFGIELSADNAIRLYIPHGFAHGYAILSEQAIVQYKCDQYYDASLERGIRPDDAALNIDWKVAEHDRIISDKDKRWPDL